MNNKSWTISVVAGILLVVGVLATLFGTGLRYFFVQTPSMGTVAPVGTLVAVHARTSYQLGDVVTYERDDRSYTHRIVDVTSQGFITKGDINGAADALPVQASQIVGTAVFYGKYFGFLAEGLPWIIVGWALVHALTLLPRVRPSMRWQIRFVGWSFVVSAVALWFRPWVNMVMTGYLPHGDGVDMHLVNTGIFPVNVLGTVLRSGQDAIVTQTVMDSHGRYSVTPQLALNLSWFLVLLAICLTPMVASLLVRIEDPAATEEVRVAAVETPKQRWRRIRLLVVIIVTCVVGVAIVLQWSTNGSLTARITNSSTTASTRTWFSCQNAETGTTGAYLVWTLTANGTQTDLKGRGNDGTMRTPNGGLAPTFSSSSPCPRDTQGSLMFNGSTCVFTRGNVMSTETYSEEVWFQSSRPSLNGKLMGFADNSTPTTGNQKKYDRHIYLDPDGRVVFGVVAGIGQATVSSPAGRNYANNAWHHVVATSAPGTISLYVDGRLMDSRSDTAGQDMYKGDWLVGCGLLAGWPDGAGTARPYPAYYTGNLRFAAIYDATLTATQVEEHYLAGAA